MAKVSLRGMINDTDEREFVFTNKQTTVERSFTKDLITVPYPPDDQKGGEYVFDIGFVESSVSITTSLVGTIYDTESTPNAYTPAEVYHALEYMAVMDTEVKTFYYLGYEYDVYISNLDTAQVAGRGNEITARIKLKVAAESS